MNSPTDLQPDDPSLLPRVSKLEATCEYILIEFQHHREEFRELRNEMRELRNEMREELRDIRRTATTDFRVLFGALIAVALGISGLMARGFGWL